MARVLKLLRVGGKKKKKKRERSIQSSGKGISCSMWYAACDARGSGER